MIPNRSRWKNSLSSSPRTMASVKHGFRAFLLSPPYPCPVCIHQVIPSCKNEQAWGRTKWLFPRYLSCSEESGRCCINFAKIIRTRYHKLNQIRLNANTDEAIHYIETSIPSYLTIFPLISIGNETIFAQRVKQNRKSRRHECLCRDINNKLSYCASNQ